MEESQKRYYQLRRLGILHNEAWKMGIPVRVIGGFQEVKLYTKLLKQKRSSNGYKRP
ncbi:hypothetical protein [Ureibacillus massiliensis]|uniref:hypothetical protein n=1 Tax=Ureibacillus massiliensis TaxID=292806 RepID=UPI0012EC0962|nr:hypothetical protein [Ureibacillus massiliensis]